MKICRITIHNFRSVRDATFVPEPYTALVGPNNHGKSNIIRALLFFFDEVKVSSEDFLTEVGGARAEEMWVEVEYSNFSPIELENIPPEYLLSGSRMRVRRECKLSDLKPVAHGYELKGTAEALSEDDFFGAKGVGKSKLGDVVFIPAIRDVKDELKPQGSTALSNLVKQIVTPTLCECPEYERLSEAMELFENALRGQGEVARREQRTYSSLNEIEATLNEELREWHCDVKMQIKPMEPVDIVRQGTSLTLRGQGEPDGLPESKGHGIQRSLLVALLKILAEAERANRLRASSSSKKVFRPICTLVLFEEPEIFQHPPRQAKLFEDLRQLSKRDDLQIIVSSHSSHFLHPDLDLKSVVQVRKDPYTVAYQVSQGTLEELAEEVRQQRLDVTRWLNGDRSSLFFCDRALLVEGATEKIVIPYLSSRYRGSLDGFYVMDCGLKTNIKHFMRLCSDLRITHIVLHDADDNLPLDNWKRAENQAIEAVRNQSTIEIHSVSPKFEAYFGIGGGGGIQARKPFQVLQFFKENEVKRDALRAILPEIFPPLEQ